MAQIVWCNLCKRNVTPDKKFNWLVFIFLCGIPYAIWYAIFKKPVCPICNGSNFSPMRQDEEELKKTIL
jgi:hypothetical protein